MYNCLDYKVSNVKPKTGYVLVELQLSRTITAGGIHVPEDSRDYPVEAIVRRLGPEPKKKPFEFVVGDRVVVPIHRGTVVNEGPKCLKLMAADDIVGVFV